MSEVRYFKRRDHRTPKAWFYYRVGACWDASCAEVWNAHQGRWVMAMQNTAFFDNPPKEYREIQRDKLPKVKMRK